MNWFLTLSQDAVTALRHLRRQPMFVATAVVLLALGIGFIAALFNVVNATMLRPWQVAEPSSVVLVGPAATASPTSGALSFAEYLYVRERADSFSHLAMTLRGGEHVTVNGQRVTGHLQTDFVSSNYFSALHLAVPLGRDFAPHDEDYRSPTAVAIISDCFWREHFQSRPDAIGSILRIREHPFTIVGVAPSGFAGVEQIRVDLWLPLPALTVLNTDWSSDIFRDPTHPGGRIIGRLRKGVASSRAQAELNVLSGQFKAAYGSTSGGVQLTDTRPISQFDAGLRRHVQVYALLFVSLGMVLLVTCANIGNLLLARGLSRQREIAVRLSLGATRARVTRQLLTEAAVLSCLGGIVGMGIAALVPRVVLHLARNTLSRPAYFTPDALVFAFAFALALVAALLTGLMPALRVTRGASLSAVAGRYETGIGGGRLRSALLTTQVAVTTVLLVSAGLLTRAVSDASSGDPGIDMVDLHVLDVTLPGDIDPDRRTAVWRAVADQLIGDPTLSVAWARGAPFGASDTLLRVRRASDRPESQLLASVRSVSSNYFDVLEIPLLTGRPPASTAEPVEIVVSESLARQFWPTQGPLGQVVLGSYGAPAELRYEVVGVAANVQLTPDDSPPTVYRLADRPANPTLIARGAMEETLARVGAIVRHYEPDAEVAARSARVALLDSVRDSVLGSRIAWAIGSLALLLAFVGNVGVVSYTLQERRREIAIRLALGADVARIVRFIAWIGGRAVSLGLAGGLVLSVAGTPMLRHFLYGVSPSDPLAYVTAAVIVCAAAATASCVPAWRAARFSSPQALREDG